MRYYFLQWLLVSSIFAFGQNAPILSESAEVSLLTCSPGKDVYEAFGHTAIRVKDEPNGVDFAFNYGTFDFGQPNFYVNFVKGKLLYMLSASRTENFVNYYHRYNRSVSEQVLDLTQAEKQRLINALDENVKPENRDYLYDYFFDNCSTRPRDVILSALEGKLSLDSTDCEHWSIRKLMNSYMGEERAWGRLGINICLSGPRIDQPSSAWEYMYLPQELMFAFDRMTLSVNGEARPLVKETRVLSEMEPEVVVIPKTTPRNVFVGILLLIAAVVTSFRIRGKSVRILEGTVFMTFGILSLLFLFLWLGTDHFTAYQPYSLLWAVPTHLFFAWTLFKKDRPIWIRWYSVATAVLMAVVLAGWNMLPVEFLSEVRFLVILQLFLAIGIIRSGARKAIPE
ncbi:MAG: hypothetical protein ACI85F_001837 [Bacteroidia bacterium]|jgi:hypothetical protein